MTNNQHGEDRLDGNGVSLDRQIALLNENALSYEASLTTVFPDFGESALRHR